MHRVNTVGCARNCARRSHAQACAIAAREHTITARTGINGRCINGHSARAVMRSKETCIAAADRSRRCDPQITGVRTVGYPCRNTAGCCAGCARHIDRGRPNTGIEGINTTDPAGHVLRGLHIDGCRRQSIASLNIKPSQITANRAAIGIGERQSTVASNDNRTAHACTGIHRCTGRHGDSRIVRCDRLSHRLNTGTEIGTSTSIGTGCIGSIAAISKDGRHRQSRTQHQLLLEGQ